MKKKCIKWCCYSNGTNETLRKMKLLIIFFFSGLLAVSAASYSQQTKFNFDLEKVTIKKVFEQIEKNSEFVIFYNEAYLDLDQTIDVKVEEGNVEAILNKVFEESGNKFNVYDRQIVILPPGKKRELSLPEKQNQPQEKEITGRVVDEDGMPLPGASLVIKGTTNGTSTNIDGNFVLKVPSKGEVTLVVQFIGFDAKEVTVGTQTKLQITLSADNQSLEEVVVIGYGTVKKSDLTGSVATVTEKDFNIGGAISTPEELIQGRVAGVQISTLSAEPGSEPLIRIRGNNSIQGSNSPLYVVDGVPMEGLNNSINVADIKSMEILKDASAAAIYGTRGANGVVLITTKRGVEGKVSIDYSFEQSVSLVANKDAYEFMNAQEFVGFKNSEAVRNGNPEPYSPEMISIINKYGEGTDWMNEVFQQGNVQKHNVSLSSGSKSTRVFLSTHFMDWEGVVPNTNFKKITSRINLDQNMLDDKLKVRLSATVANNEQNFLGFRGSNMQSNIMRNIFKSSNPITPANLEDWTEEDRDVVFGRGVRPFYPLKIIESAENLVTSLNLISNGSVEYEIMEGLTFKTQVGINLNNEKMRRFLASDVGLVATDIDRGSAHLRHSKFTSKNIMNVLRYSKVFGNNHSIDAIAVYENDTRKGEHFSAAVTNLTSESLKWNNLGAGSTILPPSSGIYESKLISYMGRVIYSFDNRYNFTATFRRDGSSKFGSNNKWGNFPSVAGAWKVHNEQFFNVDFISNLKLRAGWGVTGSDRFPIGLQQAVFNPNAPVTLDTDDVRKGIVADRLGNKDLQWEETKATNFGLELGLFDDKVSIEVDLYKKLTEKLLWQKTLPGSATFSTVMANVGEMENKGFEILLSTENINSVNFRWTSNFTFSMNKNEIKKLLLPENVDFLEGPTVGHHIKVSALKEGESVSSFYGYKFRGILQEGQVDALQPDANPGDALYEDTNGDKVVNSQDRVVLGVGIPKYIFGLNNRVVYKNWELAFNFQGVAGLDILNLNKIVGYDFGTLASSLDKWTPENTSGTLPQNGWGRTHYTNDYNLEKGDYIRLKTLRLAYNVPTSKLGLSWIKTLNFYFTGTNLLTFSNYSGFDPEVNSRNGASTNLTLSSGVDSYSYPYQKQYSFGVKIGF